MYRAGKIIVCCLLFLLASASLFGEPALPRPQSLASEERREAVAQPLLRWTPIADALQYELEIWTRSPEEAPEGFGPLLKTKQVFQAAYQADFSLWEEEQTLYWW